MKVVKAERTHMKLSTEEMIQSIIATRLASMDIYDLTRFYREAELQEFNYATPDEVADIYYREVEDIL